MIKVETVLEKIDTSEEIFFRDFGKAPEVLILDINTSIVLKEELNKDFAYRLKTYHEYTLAVVDTDEETIRFY